MVEAALPFNPLATTLVHVAVRLATKRDQELRPEHLLLALLEYGSDHFSVDVLSRMGLMSDADRIVTEMLDHPPESAFSDVIRIAVSEALGAGDAAVGPEHLVMGMLHLDAAPIRNIIPNRGNREELLHTLRTAQAYPAHSGDEAEADV